MLAIIDRTVSEDWTKDQYIDRLMHDLYRFNDKQMARIYLKERWELSQPVNPNDNIHGTFQRPKDRPVPTKWDEAELDSISQILLKYLDNKDIAEYCNTLGSLVYLREAMLRLIDERLMSLDNQNNVNLEVTNREIQSLEAQKVHLLDIQGNIKGYKDKWQR